MNIIISLLTPNKWSRPQAPLNLIKAIVIHWVANPNTTALANRNYFESRKNGNLDFGSAHEIIDLNGDIIIDVPDNEITYNCGSTTYTQRCINELGNDPNACTYAIECTHIDWSGKMTDATYNILVNRCADLCKKYNLDPLKNLWLHKEVVGWKDCHRWFVNNPNEWIIFKQKVYDIIHPKPIQQIILEVKPMVTLLKVGSTGQAVVEMQLMLNKLGFNCGVADGIFGNGTKIQVIAFQNAFKLTADGIVGNITLIKLIDEFHKKCITTGYRKVRDYGSDLHIYETSNNEDVDVTTGKPGLEPLSTITDGKIIVTKTNGGFFNLDGSTEHLGLFIDEGKYYTPENIVFIDFIYYKDGHTEIGRVKDLVQAAYLQGNAKWAIGTSYSLIKNGHICIENSQYFDHATQKNPRTLLGQRRNGTFVLVVVQGRTLNNSGINAKQSAELLFRLGCINAVNLDGGGSSEMIVNNQIMNKPSDGKERKIGSVIIVYKK